MQMSILRITAIGFLGLMVIAGWRIHDSAEKPTYPATKHPPKLLVLLVFDQFRGDYLTRWQDQFGPGGFRRIQQDGAWFRNCHYPYSSTVTAAGHASILTGCPPSIHGIVGNEWYDRHRGEMVSCVASDRYLQVPPLTVRPNEKVSKKATDSASPDHLNVESFADILKAATHGKARVVTVSMKDRSAVLTAGRSPDACYWFNGTTGSFVTSTYYREGIHDWVDQFNRSRVADRWFGQDWTRIRPDLDYLHLSGPDEISAEGTGSKQGRCFPHSMTGGLQSLGSAYYAALYNSPFGNDMLAEFAEAAIDAESLGQDPVTDLLVVSFPCNDVIGHTWGPDSQEVLDVTLRSDMLLERLLKTFDAKVGKGQYLLAITADHGVCPLPEVSRSQGKEAMRIPSATFGKRAEAFLEASLGTPSARPTRWIESSSNDWIFLDHQAIHQRGLDPEMIASKLAEWLRTQPGVLTTYTRSQLELGQIPKSDAIGQQVKLSYDADRCGDILIVLKPYHLVGFAEFPTGTTHGSPHPYDTHVPLLVFGPGIVPRIHDEKISPLSIAAIFSAATGIRPPRMSTTRLPSRLFDDR